MFDITMLPAGHGDAIWIEYGDDASKRHICIDGGPIGTFGALRAQASVLPPKARTVELLVVSHVDTDHIEGIVRMFASPRSEWPFRPVQIWFNGYHHLSGNTLGGRDGEYLSALVRKNFPNTWNTSFNGGPVALPASGAPLSVRLPGGMELTLLSPSRGKLSTLRKKWTSDLKQAKLRPGEDRSTLDALAHDRRYRGANGRTLGKSAEEKLELALKAVDPSAANGSSIAFLAQYDGRSCLFLADAHMDLLCESIRSLLPEGADRLEVDAVKLSHHGSANNISREFMDLIDAKHYLISTNGAKHEHPDRETIDAILAWSVRDPVIWFNYDSATTAIYRNLDGSRAHTCHYPATAASGITLRL